MHGELRWRLPGTTYVFHSSGARQWVFDSELPDGTLVDRANHRWVPEAVTAPTTMVWYEISGFTTGRGDV